MKPNSLLIFILLLKAACSWLALNVFTKFTVILDPFSYATSNFSGDMWAGRTQFVSAIASYLAGIINPTVPHYVFAWLNGVAVWIFLIQIPRSMRFIILPLFFLPSVAMWTSLVSKESIAATAVCLILAGWVRIISRQGHSLLTFCTLCGGLFVYGFLRPHFALGAVALVVLSLILIPYLRLTMNGPLLRNPLANLSFGIIITIGLICALSSYQQFRLGLDDIVGQALTYFRHDIGGSSRNHWLTWSQHSDFYDNAWWSIPFGVIGPLPGEVMEKAKFAPALAEGLLIFFIPLIAFLVFVRKIKRHPDSHIRYLYKMFFIVLPIVTAYLITVHAPHGTMNAGSAIRYRAGFEYLITIPWIWMGLQIFKAHGEAGWQNNKKALEP
jgi:hypothetical protein